jgi:hypothetical protein
VQSTLSVIATFFAPVLEQAPQEIRGFFARRASNLIKLSHLDKDSAQADIESKVFAIYTHVTPYSSFTDTNPFLPYWFDFHIYLHCVTWPMPYSSTEIAVRSFRKPSFPTARAANWRVPIP